jgi:very-short-patch-repair endonuclease
MPKRVYVRPKKKKVSPSKALDKEGNLNRVTTTDGKIYRFSSKANKWFLITPTKTSKDRSVERAETLRSKATPAEKALRKLFRGIGIAHTFQKRIEVEKNKWRYGDFYIPGLKWIIEVDGGYHEDLYQQELDDKRTAEIEKSTGFKVVRFTNDEVVSTPEKVIGVIIDEMSRRSLEMFTKTKPLPKNNP